MISKLPSWVEASAFILALVAGIINAVGLLSFEHQAVSHLSGTATLLGTSFLGDSWLTVFHLFGVLLFFVFGASLGGFLLHGSTLKLGRHYDTALFIESGLLIGAIVFLSQDSFIGHFLASAACGLQNALATTYSGAIVRTTHVTGIFTDLGLMIGAVFRGETFDKRKVKLFSLIIFGFIIGGIIGAFLYQRYFDFALVFPAIICFVIAMYYRMYLRK